MLIQILLEKGITASKSKEIMKSYPQVVVNAKVNNNKKTEYETNEIVQKAVNEIKEEFKENGRVVIRPSGTEPKIRVMIEGEDAKYLQKKAEELAALITKELG